MHDNKHAYASSCAKFILSFLNKGERVKELVYYTCFYSN